MQDTPGWNPGRPWQTHASTYRSHEMQLLARWIGVGISGSVVGLHGSGKSDLLGFLCHRTDVLSTYLPNQAQTIFLLPVDLNNLPARTLSALYRVILRAFYEQRGRFDSDSRTLIAQHYQENRAVVDPFLPQSALRELLLHFQARGDRLVFVLDRFDAACRMLTPEMGDTLRGLRDSFKSTLSYIAGMRQTLAYLPDPALIGDLYRLLDAHICYVGPLTEADTRTIIAQHVNSNGASPDEAQRTRIWALTGGYPSLLRIVCRWWVMNTYTPPLEQWTQLLCAEPGVRYRLDDIWAGLTQEEQMVLSEVQRIGTLTKTARRAARAALYQRHDAIVRTLTALRLCRLVDEDLELFCELFAAHVVEVGAYSRGKIVLDEQTQELYQGEQPLTTLTPTEFAILRFLVQQPRIRHPYSAIIAGAWADEVNYAGVSTENLHQVIRGLRQKIEPDPAQPVYIVNWRGKPEGGYQFFPEGKPRA
ncbi:MAG: winged helix-turn-helix domain-containing protein [Caldilineaceae bacterium]